MAVALNSVFPLTSSILFTTIMSGTIIHALVRLPARSRFGEGRPLADRLIFGLFLVSKIAGCLSNER